MPRATGAAVLLISEDLEEIFALADRIGGDATTAGFPRRGRRRSWTLAAIGLRWPARQDGRRHAA